MSKFDMSEIFSNGMKNNKSMAEGFNSVTLQILGESCWNNYNLEGESCTWEHKYQNVHNDNDIA